MTIKMAMNSLKAEYWPKTDMMYNVGFRNADGDCGETQFDIHGTKSFWETAMELDVLFSDFCKEENCPTDSVTYVEAAGKIC